MIELAVLEECHNNVSEFLSMDLALIAQETALHQIRLRKC